MEDLLRSVRARKHLGIPIPTVFPALKDKGAELYRGTYTLVVAAPGRGKSLFALTIATLSGVRALYISPDNNEAHTAETIAAMLSGDHLSEVKQARRDGQFDLYESLINDRLAGRLRFTWNSPTLSDINEEMEAFGMVYGSYPELVVIDNIGNIFADADKQTSLTISSQEIKILAHEKGAAVIALHHLTKGDWSIGTSPPDASAVLGQIDKDPEQVWGLWGSPNRDVLNVSILKNRDGPADPTGGFGASMSVDYERAEIQ